MLALIKLQQQTGMTIKALGDREQCQTIEAGDTIEIMRRVLPSQAMPELLTTVRQGTTRLRRIAALFRGFGRPEGMTVAAQQAFHLRQTKQAIAMKREDGTILLAGGDQEQVIAAIADLYITRRDHLLASGSKRGITVSALTNEDVADISGAIRTRLKARGEIGADEVVYHAVDQNGRTYELPLATGDKVRLFRKTSARIEGKRGFIGSNGDIVEIVSRSDTGLQVRNAAGEVGDVAWAKMTDSKSGRVLLGFGHALTIDAAQGITSDEHINAMPRGSSGATAFKAYVAESRHVKQSWTVVAEGAVHEAIKHARSLGDQAPVTTDDLFDQIARDMAKRPYKSLATDLINAIHRDSEAATRDWILHDHAEQSAERQGRDVGAEARERLRRERLQQALAKHVVAIDAALARNDVAMRDLGQGVTGHLDRLRADTVAAHNRLAEARRQRSERTVAAEASMDVGPG
jgi:hypothetical protein